LDSTSSSSQQRKRSNCFLCSTSTGVEGAAWIEGDGYVDPASLTMAYAAGARAGGVTIVQGVRVTGLERRGRRVTTVVTSGGNIEAECVINATGMWGREIAAMVGMRVPVCAVEHQYLVTERTDRIPAGLPTLRDPDADVYVKPEPGALAVGGWEPNTRAWGAGGIAHDFGPELLPPDFDRFSPLAEEASERIPLLNEVGIRQMINGPIPITADGEPIIGLSPELDNFYLCCGFTSGIAASGGAGWVMANWIVDGDPGLDLWPFDVRRFGTPHSVKSFMYERAVESYARYYHIAWPNYDPDAGRGARRSPLHATLLGAGAVYGNKFGWERPNWFGEAGMHAVEVPSFGRGPAFEAIGAEHRAVRERVALIDMSSFSKYEVHGPGALALLQKIAGNDVDRPVGTIVYTQLCNERGGIEADVTITRLAADRFYFVTGSALGVRDRSTIERHMPHDGSVTIDDLTSARSVLNVTGPRSRDLLARLCDAPLDNLAFPYMSARPLDVGYAPVLALRVTYTGELGYELHVPIEYALYSTRSCGRRARDSASQMPATAPSTACASKSTTSPGARTSRRTTILSRRASVSASRSARPTASPATPSRASRRRDRRRGSRGSRRPRTSTCTAAKSCWQAGACLGASRAAVTATPWVATSCAHTSMRPSRFTRLTKSK
jgi:4-methylaminobutanoate oxidase (formaldehyde-forming)